MLPALQDLPAPQDLPVPRALPVPQALTVPRALPVPRAPRPTGATGPAGDSVACACVAQMRNVLQQIIQLYPTDNIVVSMESGDNASGRPGSLLPAPNTNPTAGLLQLTNSQGVAQESSFHLPDCSGQDY